MFVCNDGLSALNTYLITDKIFHLQTLEGKLISPQCATRLHTTTLLRTENGGKIFWGGLCTNEWVMGGASTTEIIQTCLHTNILGIIV